MAPGYLTPDADTKAVRDIVQRLFKDANAPGIFIEDENQMGAALAKRLAPDVAISPAEPEIGEVHRHTDDGDIYFIANTNNQPQNVEAAFRVAGMQAEIWNPMDGSVSPATVAEKSASSTTVHLNLAPYASTIVVFTKRTPAHAEETRRGAASVPQPVDLSTRLDGPVSAKTARR